jgi:hypothetical protein
MRQNETETHFGKEKAITNNNKYILKLFSEIRK